MRSWLIFHPIHSCYDLAKSPSLPLPHRTETAVCVSSLCQQQSVYIPYLSSQLSYSILFIPWRNWYFLREFSNLFPDTISVSFCVCVDKRQFQLETSWNVVLVISPSQGRVSVLWRPPFCFVCFFLYDADLFIPISSPYSSLEFIAPLLSLFEFLGIHVTLFFIPQFLGTHVISSFLPLVMLRPPLSLFLPFSFHVAFPQSCVPHSFCSLTFQCHSSNPAFPIRSHRRNDHSLSFT